MGELVVVLSAALARLGLRAKIALTALGAMSFAIGGLLISIDHLLDRELTRAYQIEAKAVGKGLKLQLERLLQLGIKLEDLIGFEEQLGESIKAYTDLDHAMVVARDGAILFHTDALRVGLRVADTGLVRAMEQPAETMVLRRAGGKNLHSAVVPVFGADGGRAAAIVVAVDAAAIERHSLHLEIYGAGAGLIFLVAGMVAVMVAMSAFVTRPVSDLVEAVESVQGEGETVRPVPVTSRDEVGRLAVAFNAMAGRLGAVIERERALAAAAATAREQANRSAALERAVRELENAQDASLNLLEDLDHRRQELEAEIETRKQAEAVATKINRVLRVLSAGNAALVQATDEAALLKEMCRILVEVGGYRMAWIGFAEQDAAKTVRPVAYAGHDGGYLDSASMTWADDARGRGPTGTAVRAGVVQVDQNMLDNSAMAPWRESALRHGYASGIALPLKRNSTVFGAVSIYAGAPNAFDDDEIKLLVELADDLAYGITALRGRGERDVAVRRLEHSMEATIAAIANTVEMRDPYTAGHQRRVAELATAIAKELGLEETRVRGLHLAAVVHDVGKIHIPAEILSKPTRLTPVERQLVQTHAQAGFDILKDVAFPWPIAQMIVQHHERLDGSGYPNGTKGDAILPESRILAVADVVESMMSHRPYRPGLGLDAALAEIEEGKGRLYDAAAVDACVKLMRSKAFAFEFA